MLEFYLIIIQGNTRLFSYPTGVGEKTKTWKESEGMGYMPLEVTWIVRFFASVYALAVLRDVVLVVLRIYRERGVVRGKKNK